MSSPNLGGSQISCRVCSVHTFVFPLAPDNTIGGHIVHGDLKGANILVNEQGEAALADFGLSSVIAFAGEATTSTFNGGSVRWMAPELLFTSPHDGTQKTRASDTYSYGSVILEVVVFHLAIVYRPLTIWCRSSRENVRTTMFRQIY